MDDVTLIGVDLAKRVFHWFCRKVLEFVGLERAW